MTCIVGWVEKGTAYIGGDSAGIAGSSLRIRQDEKVFKIGEMIFGITGSFRMGQVLRYSFKPPKHPKGKSNMNYLCTDFIKELTSCFKDNGYSAEKGCTFMLGYQGNLYTIYSDFQISKETDNFISCGSGDEFALGALRAMEKQSMNPIKRLRIALDTSAHFCTEVAPPFKIVSTKKK